MSENIPPLPENETRNKAIKTAGWTAGLSALFITGTIGANPSSWPVATGAVAVAAMVAVVCYFILKR